MDGRLYYPVSRNRPHILRRNPQSLELLAAGRILHAQSPSEVINTLAYLRPQYYLQYLNSTFDQKMLQVQYLKRKKLDWNTHLDQVRREYPEKDQLELNNEDFVSAYRQLLPEKGYAKMAKNAKTVAYRMAELSTYDQVYMGSKSNKIWTRVAESPLEVNPTISARLKEAATRRWQDMVVDQRLTLTREAAPGITNLMILASQGKDTYISALLREFPQKVPEEAYQKALPYALEYPETYAFLRSRVSRETEETQLYRAIYEAERTWAQLPVPPSGSSFPQLTEVFAFLKMVRPKTYRIADKFNNRYWLTQLATRPFLLPPFPDLLPIYGAYQWKGREVVLSAQPRGYSLEEIKKSYHETFILVLTLARWLIPALARIHQAGYIYSTLTLENLFWNDGKYQLVHLYQDPQQTKLDNSKAVGSLLLNLWQTKDYDPVQRPLVQLLKRLQKGTWSLAVAEQQLEAFSPSYTELALFELRDGLRVMTNYLQIFVRIKQLGEGGFGVVDLVQDSSGKSFAAKSESVEDLVEDTILPSLSHYPNCDPNLLCVYDTFYYLPEGEKAPNYRRLILTEYIDGTSLSEAPNGPRHPRELFLWLIRTIQALHAKGIVHHDISTHNVMLATDGSYRLIDFGLACEVSQGNCKRHAGNPAFMAPELYQSKKQGPIDFYLTDNYGIGATMRRVFSREEEDSPEAPEAPEMEVVRGLMEPDPTHRWSLIKAENRLLSL